MIRPELQMMQFLVVVFEVAFVKQTTINHVLAVLILRNGLIFKR